MPDLLVDAIGERCQQRPQQDQADNPVPVQPDGRLTEADEDGAGEGIRRPAQPEVNSKRDVGQSQQKKFGGVWQT